MGKLVVPILLLSTLLLALTGCPRDPAEEERAERARLVSLYEKLILDREVETVRALGRGMGTVLALRVLPDAHDTARTAVALIVDDLLADGDSDRDSGGDGIKAVAVLVESDAWEQRRPQPFVATWVDSGRVERALRTGPPETITAPLDVEELTFHVAGTEDNRLITLRLYYTTRHLTERLAEMRRRENLPEAPR